MWSHTKSRANLTGIPFNLELSDIVIPERCPVLGIELQASSRGKHGASPNSPSLDRIVPKLGYVKGNVRIISFRANAIKYNATAAELRLVADYAEKVEREFNQ